MARRFYFTIADTAEDIGYDHIGNIRGAMTYAQKLANETGEEIVINDFSTDDIIDFAYPDEEVTV